MAICAPEADRHQSSTCIGKISLSLPISLSISLSLSLSLSLSVARSLSSKSFLRALMHAGEGGREEYVGCVLC